MGVDIKAILMSGAVAAMVLSVPVAEAVTPLGGHIKLVSWAKADDAQGPRDKNWRYLNAQNSGIDFSEETVSIVDGAQADAVVTNRLNGFFISSGEAEITLSASLDYASSVSPNVPQPYGLIQFSSAYRYVFKADHDGELFILMEGEGSATVANDSSPIIPGARLYASGETIQNANGVYKEGVQSVTIPLVKGNVYSIDLSSGFSASGGIHSQYRSADFTVYFRADYQLD